MNKALQKFLMLCIILASISLLTIIAVRTPLLNERSAAVPVNQKNATLPEDVENVLKHYTYSEQSNQLHIEISGKQIVRRGKKILGLRSNLVKTNFFEDINGSVSGPSGKLAFSASDAEWDIDPAHPLLLKKNVSVTVNNRTFPNAKNARIYFRQGVVEVKSDRTEVYSFK